VAKAELSFPEEEQAMELVMDAIRAVRTRRAEMNVPPSKKAQMTIVTGKQDLFRAGEAFLKRLAYVSEVIVTDAAPENQAGMVGVVTEEARVFIPLAELVDLAAEKARMEKELGKKKGELAGLENKLSNPGFVSKAPANVVQAERERAEKLVALIAKLEEQLAAM
jgi:valyl-tRNA synthetase